MTTFYQHLLSWLESVHSIKFSWSVGLGGWVGGLVVGGWCAWDTLETTESFIAGQSGVSSCCLRIIGIN